MAVLAILAFYVVSGNYSFTRPIVANQPAPAPGSDAPTISISQAQRVAETSAASFSQSGAVIESGLVASSDEPFITEAATEPQQAAVIELTPEQPATAPIQPAPVSQATAPDVAPAAQLTTTTTAQRWAAAGIVLVTQAQAWNERSLTNVDAALSLLPASILSNLGNPAFGSLPILVNQDGQSLNGSQPYGGVANYFSTNDGVNELVLFPGQRVTTVLHELGHAYNLRATPAGHYAKVLVDPEMQSFLAATGWSIVTPRDTVATAVDHTRIVFEYEGTFRWPEVSHFDPLEDYANAFALYHADPDRLRAVSQERHAWMAANLPR